MTATDQRRRSAGAEPRVRFRHLLTAEWIKIRSLRSLLLGLAIGTLAAIGVDGNSAGADYENWSGADPKDLADPAFTMHDVFTNNAHLIVLLAFGYIGAAIVVGEYGSGLIRTTFAAVPDRRAVLAAKVAVVTAITTLLGVITVAVSFGVTQAMLSGRYHSLSLSQPPVLRFLVASVLLGPVAALVGAGLGVLIRHSATTMVTVIAALIMLPNIIDSRKYAWVNNIHNATPFYAWQRLGLEGPIHPAPGEFAPPSVLESWLVYAAWPLVLLAVAMFVIGRRDV